MNPLEFKEKLKELSEQYAVWYEPIEKFRKEYRREHDIEFDSLDILFEAVDKFTERQRKINDLPGAIENFLDQHFAVYLDARRCNNLIRS